MILGKIKLVKSGINILNYTTIVNGGDKQYQYMIDTSEEWKGFQLFVNFNVSETEGITLEVTDNIITVPNGVLEYDTFNLSFKGIKGDVTYASTVVQVEVKRGAFVTGDSLPTETVFQKYMAQVIEARDNAKESEVNAKNSEDITTINKDITDTNKDITETNKDITESNKAITETNKNITEENKDKSVQALTDLLNMLGTDIATLTDGKLTASQIPNISINNSFLIADESELPTLKAEIGDMAYQEDDEQKVIALWWLVGNNNEWKKLGLSFVAESGHSNTSDNADNANKINHKRIVTMSYEDYISGAKADDTIYFTYRG